MSEALTFVRETAPRGRIIYPHLAAGPIALAMSDMATLLIYLNLAKWLL